MILTGIADEAGASIDAQIQATKELGWKHIEARSVKVEGFPKANLHDLDEAALDIVEQKLAQAGVKVYALGSTIANWSKKVEDPFDLSDVERAISRMQRLGIKFVRIMSYAVREGEDQMEEERFRRVREITKRFVDAGLTPVHENCMNYGGMSWRHAQKLLENVPGLKWVFDTGNPVFNDDRSRPAPHPKQNPWEFWTHVKEHVAHIHIKDAIWSPEENDADYTMPGNGDAEVKRILKDAFAGGYDAGISIEPHLAVVFHDDSKTASDPEIYNSYIRYGRRMMEVIDAIKEEIERE